MNIPEPGILRMLEERFGWFGRRLVDLTLLVFTSMWVTGCVGAVYLVITKIFLGGKEIAPENVNLILSWAVLISFGILAVLSVGYVVQRWRSSGKSAKDSRIKQLEQKLEDIRAGKIE